MWEKTMIFFLLCMLMLVGCNSTNENDVQITEEEAMKMVEEAHARDDKDIEILSVSSESDKFIIQWEIEPIQEGKDSVDRETGEIKAIESSTGTCKWF